jgi:hypothetical protein
MFECFMLILLFFPLHDTGMSYVTAKRLYNQETKLKEQTSNL